MADGMPTHYDPIDPATVPEWVRHQAFRAAMIGLERVLEEHGYRVDAFAAFELLDTELGKVAYRLGASDDDPEAA